MKTANEVNSSRLTPRIKQCVQSILKGFGLRLVRDGNGAGPGVPSPDDGLRSFFAAIRQLGFRPRHILDVGANRGSWTRKAIAYFPDAHYTLIEPQDGLKTYIRDLIDQGYKIKWINAGAADKIGELPFTIARRDDSSSFAEIPLEARDRQVLVPVTTINDVIAETGEPVPEMVKIDAEGFDLKVLAGASALLGKTGIFFVEAAICCPGLENTIAAVIKRMDDLGYHVVDITDINRSPKYGVLWLCELAFLQNDSPLLSNVTSYE